jgi:pyrimidine operon attenuation protein/uracil phosphoribosyltransferase
MKTTTIILDHHQINQKIIRIAYQIYEANSSEKEVVIAGIQGNGIYFAEQLATSLEQISSLKIILCEVYIDKKNPLNTISTSIQNSEYKNKPIVLVDDVCAFKTI